jgi:hypothetical protein
MKKLEESLKYFGAKIFVKRFEKNPKNYDKRTPPNIITTKEYLDAIAVISSYK